MTVNRVAPAVPWRVVAINTLCFALSFAAWVMYGPSSRAIAAELHLAPGTAAWMKSLPILAGSALRIPVGILTDRLGARRMFPALMLLGALGALCSSLARGAFELIATGFVVGLVGTTFTVGIQSVSSQTPKEHQGLAMGVFGAGNVGTAITTLGMPLLLPALGWRLGFRVYAVALALGAVLYAVSVRGAAPAASRASLRALLSPLERAKTWRFGLYYMATFGVFVALTLSLIDIYVDGFHVSLRTAGLMATTFTFTTSVMRIPGGRLADRLGGRRVLRASLAVIVFSLGPLTFGLPMLATVLLVFTAGIAMGVGMAATFRYIPAHFPSSVGAVSGVVGALGGIGGFVLPMLAAVAKARFGSPFAGVLPLASVALLALIVQSLAVHLQGYAADASQPASLVRS